MNLGNSCQGGNQVVKTFFLTPHAGDSLVAIGAPAASNSICYDREPPTLDDHLAAIVAKRALGRVPWHITHVHVTHSGLHCDVHRLI